MIQNEKEDSEYEVKLRNVREVIQSWINSFGLDVKNQYLFPKKKNKIKITAITTLFPRNETLDIK